MIRYIGLFQIVSNYPCNSSRPLVLSFINIEKSFPVSKSSRVHSEIDNQSSFVTVNNLFLYFRKWRNHWIQRERNVRRGFRRDCKIEKQKQMCCVWLRDTLKARIQSLALGSGVKVTISLFSLIASVGGRSSGLGK